MDGLADAAGGIVDGKTVDELETMGISCEEILKNFDSYYTLEKAGGLIRTGATGTNVNVNEQAALDVLLAMEK